MTPGIPVALSATVRRIVAPNAGMMTGSGTNTYLLGTKDVAVLDPGPEDVLHLLAILAAVGSGVVRWIIVTHTHRDHSPLAQRLAAKSGATLIGLTAPDDGRQDETFKPHFIPRDGERLQLGASSLTAVRTPGHASNCVCYLHAGDGLMFTGDHVLEGVSPVILPPDGDMSDYLRSLDKLLHYEFDRIAPGHGGIIDQPKRVLHALRAHRLWREDKVMRVLATLDGATLEQLTPVVYDDVPPERHSFAKCTLQAHLVKLQHDGRAGQVADVWRIARP